MVVTMDSCVTSDLVFACGIWAVCERFLNS